MTTSIPSRSRRAARITAASAAVGALAFGLLSAAPAQATVPTNPVTPNPDLTQACGLDIVLVLDQSDSLAPLTADIKAAGNGLLTAFQDTNTRVGIVKFTKTAAVSVPLTYDTVTTRTGVLGAAVASYTAAGRSNWQDAFTKAQAAFAAAPARTTPVQQLIVFVSDGKPNTYTLPSGLPSAQLPPGDILALDPAVNAANTFKAGGGKVLSIVESASPSADAIQNMSSVSHLWKLGNTEGAQYFYPTAPNPSDFLTNSTAFDAKTTDFVVNVPIDTLKANLASLAASTCSRSLAVTQSVTGPSHPATFTAGGTGFDVTASTGSDSGNWKVPATGTGTSATQPSDGGGTSVFQWDADRTNLSVSQTLPLLYRYANSIVCSVDDGAPFAVTATSVSTFSKVARQSVAFTVTGGVTGNQAVNCTVKSTWTGPLSSILTLRTKASAVVYGGATLAVGTLGTPVKRLAGQVVYLQTRPLWNAKARWVTIAKLKTNKVGVVAAFVKPTYNRAYRLYYAGAPTVYRGFSPIKAVKVVPKITSSLARSGARLTLAGAVAPRSAGQLVYLQKLKAGKWVVITKAKLSRTGKYSFRFFKASTATYYRVLKLANTAYAASASRAYKA